MKKLQPKKFKKTSIPVQIPMKTGDKWHKRYFPTFYRIIPEIYIRIKGILISWKTPQFWIWLVCFVLLLFISLEATLVYESFREKRALEAKRQKIREEIAFWKQITDEYKGYRDAYFKIAVLEYQLGDKKSSRYYLQKVFYIDPQFEKGRKLEKMLK